MADVWPHLGAELVCPLCQRLFNLPVSLPCSHLFCNACIRGRLQGKGVVLNECPTCRQPAFIRDLTRNPKVASLALLMRKYLADTGQSLQPLTAEPGASPPAPTVPFAVRVADLEAWAERWLERPTPSTSSGLRDFEEVASAVLEVLQDVDSRLAALGEGAGEGALAAGEGALAAGEGALAAGEGALRAAGGAEDSLQAEAGPSAQPSLQDASVQHLRRLVAVQYGPSAHAWSKARLMVKLEGLDIAVLEEVLGQQDAAAANDCSQLTTVP